jgi:hypothetical protein
MKEPIATVLALLISLLIMSDAAFASGANCDLAFPPREAGTNANHGVIYYVFPRKLDVEYSGCQTMWDEKGRKVWIVEFKEGDPIVSMVINAEDATRELCSYRAGKLVGKNRDDCPDYEWLKQGLPTVRQGTEPDIPRDRDPRR